MRKQYEKPGLLIENFMLSECIAAGCSGVGQTFEVENGCASNFDYDALLDTIREFLGDDWDEREIDLGNGTIKICKHSSQGISVFTS